MSDRKQFSFYSELTVGQLAEILNGLPKDAEFVLCGDDQFYIHVESDGSVVNLDNNSLEDCYDDDINTEA